MGSCETRVFNIPSMNKLLFNRQQCHSSSTCVERNGIVTKRFLRVTKRPHIVNSTHTLPSESVYSLHTLPSGPMNSLPPSRFCLLEVLTSLNVFCAEL